MKAPPVRYAR